MPLMESTTPQEDRAEATAVLGSTSRPPVGELIEAKDFAALKRALVAMEIHDLVELLGEQEADDLAVCFRLLPPDGATEVFSLLEIERQEDLVRSLSSEKLASILNEMPPDDRTELLEELPGELAQRLLSTLRGDQLKIARSLLAYPADSIGRLMTPEYLAIRPGWTVEQVFAHVRKVGASKETLSVLYVVDDHWKLLDEVPLERLILAEPSEKVADLMDEQVVALDALDDQEAAVDIFKKYDASVLPAVNSQGVLVGIVTFDDVLDVAEEEGTEDFQKMAGLAPLEYSYFGTGYAGMMRKRMPWLALLLAAQLLTTVALIGFQAVPIFAVLVMFMPLINSPAGNAGSQMAGLMIRGLAVGEVRAGDWWRVLIRELCRGLSLGLILGVLGSLAAFVFTQFIDVRVYDTRYIAVSVGLALAVSVTLANLIGSMLPFFFKRIGLDPAVTSGPFIASVMDVSGILIYFSIATAALAGMD